MTGDLSVQDEKASGGELKCLFLKYVFVCIWVCICVLVSVPEPVNKSLLIGNKLNQMKFPWHKTLSGSQQREIDSTQKSGDKLVQSQWSGNRSEGEDRENSQLHS